MSLSLQQRDQLLSWTERGYLKGPQLQACATPAQLAPQAGQWQWLLDRLLACAGCCWWVSALFFLRLELGCISALCQVFGGRWRA